MIAAGKAAAKGDPFAAVSFGGNFIHCRGDPLSELKQLQGSQYLHYYGGSSDRTG